MARAMDHSNIQGWGADLDPKMRPAYPKEKTPPGGTGAHWDELEQQVSDVTVFHSIERPGVTPVYGTSCPPRGLSGVLRQFAFRFSEAQLTHWMTLLLADRVDMVEGMLEDVARGRVPALARDGWRYDLTHEPKLFLKRAAGTAAFAAGVLLILGAVRRRRNALV